MTLTRTLAALVACISLGVAAWPQSLAEIAEKEKQKKKTGAKVYTNEDLREQGAEPGASPKPSASASPTPASSPEPSSAQVGGLGEDQWRATAEARRRAVKNAEAHVAAIQTRLNGLVVDGPTNVADPFRLQNMEAERAKALQELEDAKAAIEGARKALEDFEDDARRKSVPPGWLRER